MYEGHTDLLHGVGIANGNLVITCARTMEFQLNEHHVGRPSGRVGTFRACKNMLYVAGSLVKDNAAVRVLEEEVRLALSRVRTGWRRTASVAMSWIVYCSGGTKGGGGLGGSNPPPEIPKF